MESGRLGRLCVSFGTYIRRVHAVSEVRSLYTNRGPSALALLVIETTNDYVRFHGAYILHGPSDLRYRTDCSYLAYQSAFLLTPLLILRILASLFGFWSWLQTVLTLFIGFPALYLAYAARKTTFYSRANLEHVDFELTETLHKTISFAFIYLK